MSISEVVTITSLIAGMGLLVLVGSVYWRKQTFGLGGSVLSLLGAILMGTSVWKSVTISVGPAGGFEAELTQFSERLIEVEQAATEAGNSISNVRIQVEENSRLVSGLEKSIKEYQNSTGLAPDGILGPATRARLEAEILRIMQEPDGGKIVAIKEIRGKTGMGLKEAKDFVEEVLESANQ